MTIAPPSGYEVSSDGTTYGGNGTAITVGGPGTLDSSTVYVRLAASATVAGSPYSGNIVVSTAGTTAANLATVSSTVSAQTLTITGVSAASKFYDGTDAATLTGTPAYSGLVNGEMFSVTGTPSATFATASVGADQTVTVTGYTAPSANYTVTQPALSASVLALTNASLSGLALSSGTLSPAFDPATLSYAASVSTATTSLTVTPVVADATAAVTVNGTTVSSGTASGAVTLHEGDNTITVVVTAQDGTTTKTYALLVTRTPTPSDIDFASSSFTAAAGSVTVNLVRSGGSGPATIHVSTTSGTAVAGTDFTALTGSAGTASFAQGVNTASVTISVATNTALAPKTFSVGLASPSGTARLGSTQTSATVVIPGTDATAPTLTLTAPSASVSKTVATLTGDIEVKGTADDNAGVSKIQVQVNGGVWHDVSVTDAHTTAKPHLVSFDQVLTGVLNNIYIASASGPMNTVNVRSVDVNGNTSAVKTSLVKMTVKAPLSIVLSGTSTGGMVGGAQSAGYEVGKVYSLTAKQFDATTVTDSVAAFSNWSGAGITSSSLKLTFTMSTALVSSGTITATYVSTPFLSSKVGRFDGAVTATGGSTVSNDTYGNFTVTVTSTGTFTGSLAIAGHKHSLTGALANDGTATFGTTGATTLTIDRTAFSPLPNLSLGFMVDLAGTTNKVTGSISDGTNTSSIIADRAAYSATSPVAGNYLNVTGAKGFYTIALPSQAQSGLGSTQFPQGSSVGSISLTPAGVVTGSLVMADGLPGTTVTVFSTMLSKTNTFPLFATLYPGTPTTVTKGSISGLVALDDSIGQTVTDIAGSDLVWFRPASLSGSTTYPTGWPNGITLDLKGAKYNVVAGTSVVPNLPSTVSTSVANVDLSFTGGPITSTITKSFNISPSNGVKVIPADSSFTFSLTASSGLFKGSITPAGGSAMSYIGVTLQKGSTAGGTGFVLGTNETGAVSLFHK